MYTDYYNVVSNDNGDKCGYKIIYEVTLVIKHNLSYYFNKHMSCSLSQLGSNIKISDAGNVTIGGEPSTNFKLSVSCNLSSLSTDVFPLKISAGSANSVTGKATLIGLGTENLNYAKCGIGHIRTGANDQGDIVFLNRAGANTISCSSNNEIMRITNSNVGIGKTNPDSAYKLDVYGGIKASGLSINGTLAIFTTIGINTMQLAQDDYFDVLIVGGGGGGGYWSGGGGGGGDVIELFSVLFKAGTYTINVGDGGDGGLIDTIISRGSRNGSNSIISHNSDASFVPIYAGGGGGGGDPYNTGKNGSLFINERGSTSGGGGGAQRQTSAGSGNGISGNGGIRIANTQQSGGGGGGAVGNGTNIITVSNIIIAGNGGTGALSNITGLTYGGGGGGGGTEEVPRITAGTGVDGGGNGASVGYGANGLQNTGGGGGGGGFGVPSNGGKGGSGIVVIRPSNRPVLFGIGTYRPNRNLHIHNAFTQQNVGIMLTDQTTGATATDGFHIYKNSSSQALIWNYENADMVLGTNNSERMRILANGNVGIGKTPATALDVNGTVTASSFSASGAFSGTKATLYNTVQSEPRMIISGQEFVQANTLSTDGIALICGYNRSTNRQLWIGDSTKLAPNTTNSVVRILANGIDSRSTDYSKELDLKVGSSMTIKGNLNVEVNGGTVTANNSIGTSVVLNFTGQHRVTSDKALYSSNYIGYIVRSSGDYKDINNKYHINNIKQNIVINDALPVVELSTKAYDKSVFGVISDRLEEDNSDDRKYNVGNFISVYPKEIGDDRLIVNGCGEGSIWVSDYNGPLENGDYITTSPIPGIGMKQDDDLLHNYTVAKITMHCDFNPHYIPIKVIKQEKYTQIISSNITSTIEWYDDIMSTINTSNVEYTVYIPEIKTSNMLDHNSDLVYDCQSDEHNNILYDYEYDMKYIKLDGTIVTKEYYDTNCDIEKIYKMAFVGCTYKCS